MKQNKVKAVIFDLDGTIIDTLSDIAASINTVLNRHSLKTYEVEEYKSFIGHGSRHLIKCAFKTEDEELLDQYYQEYLDCYLNNISLRSEAYPLIESSLKKLSIFGYKLYVLTNKPESATAVLLKKVFPTIKFNRIISPSDSIPPKPDLTGLQKLIEEERLDPGALIYFGDSDVDMEVAKKAGIPHRIGCLYGYQDEKRLLEGGATKIINRSKDLIFAVLDVGKTKGLSLFLTALILPLILIACNITYLILYQDVIIRSISISLIGLLASYLTLFAFQCLGHSHRLNLRLYYTFTSLILSTTLFTYLFGGTHALNFSFTTFEIVILSAAIFFGSLTLAGLVYFNTLLVNRSKDKRRIKKYKNQPLNDKID